MWNNEDSQGKEDFLFFWKKNKKYIYKKFVGKDVKRQLALVGLILEHASTVHCDL
jgi:hypothetical protein